MAATPSSSQKRKHASDATPEHSRKSKVAKTNGNDNVQIVHRTVEDNAYGPVLAFTPGLTLPSKATFRAYRTSRANSKGTGATDLLLRSSDHPRINYTATEKQAAPAASGQKHYIGIFDPQKGTVELVEARTMAIKSSVRQEDEEMLKEQERQQQTMALQRRALGQEFGTKKARKAINSLTENAVSSFAERGASAADIAAKIKQDSGANALMASMDASAANAPTRDSMQAAIDDAKPRPKGNLNATKAEDVYSLESVCDSAMLRLLKVKKWMDAIDDGEDVKVTSRYVAKRLPEIAPRDLDDTIKRVKALRFILLCLDFYKSTKQTGKGGGRKVPKTQDLVKSCNVDAEVVDMMKKRFTSKEHRDIMTKWQVDYLITHVCTAALLIEDLALDLHDLSEDLGLKTSEITKYFIEIGARVRAMTEIERKRSDLSKAEASVHRIAELKLPLEFPRQRVMPLSRKR